MPSQIQAGVSGTADCKFADRWWANDILRPFLALVKWEVSYALVSLKCSSSGQAHFGNGHRFSPWSKLLKIELLGIVCPLGRHLVDRQAVTAALSRPQHSEITGGLRWNPYTNKELLGVSNRRCC